MQLTEEKQYKALFSFLQDAKEGKYVEIDTNIIDIPRIMTTRDEYLIDEGESILFSISNQV